jgi:hypothetical protein
VDFSAFATRQIAPTKIQNKEKITWDLLKRLTGKYIFVSSKVLGKRWMPVENTNIYRPDTM